MRKYDTCLRAALLAAALFPTASSLSGVETVTYDARQLRKRIVSGLSEEDGRLVLYHLAEDFPEGSLDDFRITLSPTYGEDEYGVVDPWTDAAYVSYQNRPDTSIFVETHDNDAVHLQRRVTPTFKGFVEVEFRPTRFWPTSGTLTIELSGRGGRINFPLSASDYKHPAVKETEEKKLSAEGGLPYFSSYMTSNIYIPSEGIPESERRWWPMRLLFRPAYIAGSLDSSVCREIEDPTKTPIMVEKVHLSVQQLETYIRCLRFKSLLGETLSTPMELTNGLKWDEVGWKGSAPEKTRIGLQVRAADDKNALEAAAWSGPSAEKPYFLESGKVPDELSDRKYLQIRVLLKALIDAPFETTPEVESVYARQAGE